jgi:GTP-binding protein HflX
MYCANWVLKNKISDTTLIPRQDKTLTVSAKTGENLELLIQYIRDRISPQIIGVDLLIPYDRAGLISDLHDDGVVAELEYAEKGIRAKAGVEKTHYHKYEPFLI